MTEWVELSVHIIGGLFIIIGCFFLLAGSIGVLRMPDLYTRIHAASLIDTGGSTFIILGLLLEAIFIFESPMAAIKLILILLFINFSSPTASHAIAKMALMAGLIPQSKNGEAAAVEESLILDIEANKPKGDT